MKTNWFKRTLCSILALVMVLGYVPATAFAAEEDGLCEHHTQHTAECGYSAASEGRACNHKHADTCYETMTQCAHVHGDCGYVVAVEGHSCDCQPDENGEIVHTDGCGYVEAAAEIPCGHVCSEESGCITKVLNCQHQHDAACGYVEAAAETPCGFVCEECAKQEEAVCTGELDCPVSEHNDDCKMKEADETAVADKEAADAVAALIEALPALDEMKTKSLEEQGADYAQVQSAYDAYEKLTASQKALLPPAEEVFKPYFDYFNNQTQQAATGGTLDSGRITWKALQSETVDYGIKIGTAAVTNANLGSENWEYNPNSNILYLKDGFDASVSTTRSSLVVTVSGSVKAEKIRATGTALTLKDDGSSTTKDVLDVYWTGIQVDGGSLTAENLTLSVRASNNIAIFVGAESTADGTFTVKNAQVHAYSEGEQALQGISVGTLNVDGSSRVYGGTSRAAVSAIYIAQAGRFSSACHVEASANNGNGIYGKGITFPAYAYIRNTAPVGGSGDFTKKATATEYSGGNIQTYRSYEFVGLDHVTYTKNESGHKVSCNCNPAKTLIFCEAHDWNYNLDDTDTIEAVCSSCNATGSVTLMPPMSLISDGITAREATLDGSIPGVTPEITYEGNLTEGKPVKAGQYTAKVTLGGQTASIGFTISVKDYGIKIDTEAITSEHLSGEGWSYDSKNNVLSLSSHRWTGALSVTRDDLTVIVDGAVTLYGLRAVNITIKGKTGLASDSFTVPGNYSIRTTGDLTVKELSLRVPSIQNAEAIIVGESGTTAVGCFTVDNASVYATSTGESKAVSCIVTGSIRVLGSSVVNAKCRMAGCSAIAARGSGSSFSEECHIIASGIHPGSGGWKTGGITLPDKGYFYESGSYVLKSTVGKNITSGSDFIGTGHITCTPNGDVHKVVCKCAYPTTVISSQDHSWLYSLDTDTINAMCRACRATGSLKLEPPVETQSDGVTAREATLSGSIPGVENPVITYTGDNLENGKPVKAGSYTAKITLDEKTAEISFALTADPMLTAVATVTTGETTTPYSGLAEAVAAASVASGSTLKLLQDITLDTALEVGSGSFTLDLNDKNLNATCYDPLRISGGDLIITDTGTDSTKGSITNDFMGSAVRINGAKVSISGISINVYSQQFCYGVVMEAGELSISDCSVTSKAISYDYGIKAEGGKLTVSHCNFNSDTAIYFSGSEANISNNNIESKGSGVYAAGGTITLSENDISGNSGVLVVGDSTMVSITSGSISGVGNMFNSGGGSGVTIISGTVTISGGEVSGITESKGGTGYAVFVKNGTANIVGSSITGETFDLHKEAGGTIALGLPADGEMGAAFPGGIQVENTTLVEILGEGTSYWIGTKEQTLSADTWKIDGDVTIRKHTQHTASGYVDEKTTPDSHTSTCIFCGEELTEPHSFVEEKVDAQYLKSAANCTAAATYYKSCVCGRAGTEFFEYGPIGDHNRDEKHKCSVCGHIGGSCGDNLIWTYDAATGILTVSGTGEMAYFLPWEDYADQVTALVIKSGATTISDTAFRRFKQLKTVSIGDTVTTIGSSAFLGCSKLESITIPASVSVIKDNAFSICTKLSSVTLKEGLTAIEANAFEGCESLTELVIPNTVTAIGSMAFYNCTALRSINIPDGVKTISAYMFVSSGLTGITIPDSVTTIEKQAFAWCNSLSDEIVIPEKVTIIGENAFSWCGKIDKIHFMGNAPAVAQNAFTTVTANAYYPWDNETWTDDVKQNYGGTITWIAEGMPALTEIRVSTKPAKVVYIQNKDALDVTGGKLTLTYSDNTTTVIDLTADMVTGFDNTKLGQQRLTVTYEGCTTCLNVTVQEDPNATSGTWGDLTWKISESGILTISGIGEMLNHDDPNGWQDPSNPPVDGYPWHKHKDKITAVVVEEGLTSLAEIAFHGLENLTGVTLPDSLARIGDAAFIYCTALESIVIPENISSIGKEILVGSTSFKEITFTGNAPAFHAEAFVGVTATAYYPGNNATWTDSVKQNYGGNITWVPYGTVESRLELDLSELDGQTMAWIDGVPCTIQRIDDKGYVAIPHDNARIMTTYNYHVGDAADVHTQYPVSMKVWALEKQEDGSYKTNRVEELDNLLQYSGCSIRIVGVKGIRMITSISKSTRSALAGSGLAGYKLVEYGTALCRAGVVDSGAPMVLGTPGVKSNYAYKRGVADPIFKDTGSAIQYTNVLVGFTDEDCKEDIAMRPYIILEDEKGDTVTVYGGIVYRSIGYIAYQNRNAFPAGSDAYAYVWDIIHKVYGSQYDKEYKK